jgi:Intracellular proteinase inhibitor
MALRSLLLQNGLKLLVLVAALLLPPKETVFLPGKDLSDLDLTVTSSDVSLRSRIPVTLSVSLINPRDTALVLHFPTTCQILLYIEDLRETVRVPSAGIYICGQAATELALGARKSVTVRYRWMGTEQWEPSPGAARLRPGDYRAWAELRAVEGLVVSRKVPVRVSRL